MLDIALESSAWDLRWCIPMPNSNTGAIPFKAEHSSMSTCVGSKIVNTVVQKRPTSKNNQTSLLRQWNFKKHLRHKHHSDCSKEQLFGLSEYIITFLLILPFNEISIAMSIRHSPNERSFSDAPRGNKTHCLPNCPIHVFILRYWKTNDQLTIQIGRTYCLFCFDVIQCKTTKKNNKRKIAVFIFVYNFSH